MNKRGMCIGWIATQERKGIKGRRETHTAPVNVKIIMLSENARPRPPPKKDSRSEEHTSELQSRQYLVCRLLLEKKKKYIITNLFLFRYQFLLCLFVSSISILLLFTPLPCFSFPTINLIPS